MNVGVVRCGSARCDTLEAVDALKAVDVPEAADTLETAIGFYRYAQGPKGAPAPSMGIRFMVFVATQMLHCFRCIPSLGACSVAIKPIAATRAQGMQ